MRNLLNSIKLEDYKKVKFKISKTKHLLITAKLNGVKGNFILDTGASSSCVGNENVELFSLKAKKSKTKASGAGATGMITQISSKNSIQLGDWKLENFKIVIFDLSHINQALKEHNAKTIHGIIGADVLLNGKGIIDYYNQYLYLL